MSELPAEHVCIAEWDFKCCWSVCVICGRTITDEDLSRGTVIARQSKELENRGQSWRGIA